MSSSSFTSVEREIIVLTAVWDLIQDMVNYSMFKKFGETTDVELRPNTSAHQRLFNIILTDFLSRPGDFFDLPQPPESLQLSEQSYLFHLKWVSEQPRLNATGGKIISAPLQEFVTWLEAECAVEKIWLPSIDVETDLRVKRVRFIKLCGNIAKHNFARLDRDTKKLKDLLEENGVKIPMDRAYLVLPEFYMWFHENVLSYHMSAIAEYLNNIRWAIYEYLRPEFLRSFTRDDPNLDRYRFKFPADCNAELPRTMYWDLMNYMRSEPLMPKFEVTRFLKMRY